MKKFTIPKALLTRMTEYTRGIIQGAEFAGDISEMFEDEWVIWSDDYDINIYRDADYDIVACVHPVLPTTDPDNKGKRSVDGDRYIKLSLDLNNEPNRIK